MTYAQLESLINKWSLELEDQEKHFLQQATQVNAWDRTLIENGEKVGAHLGTWLTKQRLLLPACQPARFLALSVLWQAASLGSGSEGSFSVLQITSLHREVEKVKLDQKR